MFFVYWAFTLCCWTYALYYGGRPAQWAFALFLLAMVFTSLSTDLGQRQTLATTWSGVNLPLFITDTVYFAGLYALALRSRRSWPIWSSGLQMLCVLSHLGPIIDPGANAKIYRALESVWLLPMMLTMVIGITKDRRQTLPPSTR